MNQPPDIDEQFYQRLHDMVVPPPPHVWPNIEAELRKRRRRFYAVWFLRALAMAGMAWGLFYVFHYTSKPAINHPIPVHTPTTETAGSAKPSNLSQQKAALPVQTAGQGSATQNKSVQTVGKGAVKLPFSAAQPLPLPAIVGEVGEVVPETLPMASTDFNRVELLCQLEHRAFATQTTPPNIGPGVRVRPVRHKQPTNYCYPFQDKSPIWMFDAYLGPSMARKSLQADNASGQALLNSRLKTETQDWAFNAGVRGTVVLGRHFMLRSGLHYEQFVELFEYADPNSIQVITRATTTWIDNKEVTIIDTLDIQYGDDYTKTYNRFGMLDLPLEAGVEVRGRRSGLSVHGGVMLNVLFWKKGDMLSTQLEPVSIADASPPPFKDRVGLSVGGSVQWFYHLQPRTRLFVEPYYRQVLQPVSASGYPLTQRYGFGGLRFGITRIFP
ncbi:MAG: hypothetical protein ACOYNO_00815 [Saprospiraceae bacterium]